MPRCGVCHPVCMFYITEPAMALFRDFKAKNATKEEFIDNFKDEMTNKGMEAFLHQNYIRYNKKQNKHVLTPLMLPKLEEWWKAGGLPLTAAEKDAHAPGAAVGPAAVGPAPAPAAAAAQPEEPAGAAAHVVEPEEPAGAAAHVVEPEEPAGAAALLQQGAGQHAEWVTIISGPAIPDNAVVGGHCVDGPCYLVGRVTTEKGCKVPGRVPATNPSFCLSVECCGGERERTVEVLTKGTHELGWLGVATQTMTTHRAFELARQSTGGNVCLVAGGHCTSTGKAFWVGRTSQSSLGVFCGMVCSDRAESCQYCFGGSDTSCTNFDLLVQIMGDLGDVRAQLPPGVTLGLAKTYREVLAG